MPIHPGEYIKEELDAREWTIDDLAEITGVSSRQLKNLIKGTSGITPNTAQCLAESFGQEVETWMNLQMAYELATAAKEERHIARKAKLFDKAPVRDMRRRNWLPQTQDVEELESAVCHLYGTPNIDAKPTFEVAARKSTPYDSDNPAQIAWYAKARHLAAEVRAAEYSKSNFETGIVELLKLAAYPEDVRRIPHVLAEMGIRLVLVQALPKSKVDGVAFWLDDVPAIALSLRYDRIDNLWFNLLHELAHIKHEDASPVDEDLTGRETSEIEQRANREAAEYLVPRERLESFIARTSPQYYQTRIVQFAQARQVHPGIVVGQLQRRDELTYAQHRKLLVKVRSELIGAARTDGWE
jgi:HTH-type transcriptional regulator/antitoxin HigA